MTTFAIDYFELQTKAMERSQRFYRDAFGFGFGITPYGPGYSEITGGGVLGGLNGMQETGRGPLIGIRTDDIAAAEALIVAAGGTITTPVSAYPGGERFIFREPGGSELLVYCPAS